MHINFYLDTSLNKRHNVLNILHGATRCQPGFTLLAA